MIVAKAVGTIGGTLIALGFVYYTLGTSPETYMPLFGVGIVVSLLAFLFGAVVAREEDL